MKIRNLLFAVAAMVVAATTTASAQDLSGWTLGGKLGVYSRWAGTTGIGIYGRHALSESLRIEPTLTFLCKKGMSVDIAADVQYPIDTDLGIEVYPLAGLSLNDPGKFGLGINLGAGAGYQLTEKLNIDFGVKWIIQTQKYIANPVVFSLGCGHKF